MADTQVNSTPGSLYFIVGGLVVAMGVAAFAYYGGYIGGYTKTKTEQTTTAPAPAGGATTTTTITTEESQ